MRPRKSTIMIIGLAIIAILVFSVSSFLYLPTIWPRSTSLSISPSTFSATSGQSTAFVAVLKSGELTLAGDSVTWTASVGSFKSSTGSAVVYIVPNVTQETAVTITASFPGQGVYQPSSSKINGTVAPKAVTQTTLTISPSQFEVNSGGNVTLNALVVPSGVPSQSIIWELEGPGTLSSSTGGSTTYMAPVVTVQTSINISAEFPGTTDYTGSNAVCTGVISAASAAKNETILTTSQPSFSLEPNETVTVNATLTDTHGNVLTGKTITWSLNGPGALSTTAGSSVTYTAPGVATQNVSVIITATFPGDQGYLATSAQVIGTVTPPPVQLQELAYEMEFGSLTISGATLQGPITMAGMSVVEITGEATVSGLTINPVVWYPSNESYAVAGGPINATSGSFVDLKLYVVDVDAYSPTTGGTLEIDGGQTISTSYSTLTLQNGSIAFAYMTTTSTTFQGVVLQGKYVGGTEPYWPVVVTAQTLKMNLGYGVTGPTTFGAEVNAVNLFHGGLLDTTSFTFGFPSNYSLDRLRSSYSAILNWTVSATAFDGTNATMYVVYARVTGEDATKYWTGDINPQTVIPYGLNVGYVSPILSDVNANVVYLGLDKLTMNSTVISTIP